MHEAKLKNLLMMSRDERVDYTIRKVVDAGELWMLRNEEGWAMAGGSDGRKVFPVWPEQELARLWVGGDWADCRPASIELSDYLGRWVPGMDRDGHDVSVFPTKGKHSVVMGAIRWGELLEAECGRFPEYSWG